MATKPCSAQMLLPLRTRGGRRPGAGRPRTSVRSNAPHRTRPKHSKHNPMHVTLRGRSLLPSLRSQVLAKIIVEAIRESRDLTFGIVHFSIQHDHVHPEDSSHFSKS